MFKVIVLVGFASLLSKNCASKQVELTSISSKSCYYSLGCRVNGTSCIQCKAVSDEDECGSNCRWVGGKCKAHTCSSMGKNMAEADLCASSGYVDASTFRLACAAYGCTYSKSKCACGIAIYIIIIIVVVVIFVVVVVIVVLCCVFLAQKRRTRMAMAYATQPIDGSQPIVAIQYPPQLVSYPQQVSYPPQGQYPPGAWPAPGQYYPGPGQIPSTVPAPGQDLGVSPPQQTPLQQEGVAPQQTAKEDPPQEVSTQ